MNRIALIFDFDDTLAPDTTSQLLSHMGLDVQGFWREVNGREKAGAMPGLSWLHLLCDMAQEGRLSKSLDPGVLAAFGRRVVLHPGVADFFVEVRRELERKFPGTELEFYAISAGLEDLLNGTVIRSCFKDLWGALLEYSADGLPRHALRAISRTEKTRYLFGISKGLIGRDSRELSQLIDDRATAYPVPFNRMVYVGDGLTDTPCFSLLQQHGGKTIAVHSKDDAGKRRVNEALLRDRRVNDFHEADYRRGSALWQGILEALEEIAQGPGQRK